MKHSLIKAGVSLLVFSFLIMASDNIDSGLVAYYQFNRNANDSTSYGNNGTIHSGSLIGARFVTDRFGIDSSALSLNNSYVQVPDANSLDFVNRFTISAWTDAGGTLVSKPRAVGGTGIRFAGGTGGVSIGLNNGSQNYLLTAPPTLAAKPWHHVVVTYDGDSVKLYSDTVMVNAAEYQIIFLNSTQPLFIGCESPELGQYFTGALDDIKLYNRALTFNEVRMLYGKYPVAASAIRQLTFPHIHPINNSRIRLFDLAGRCISNQYFNMASHLAPQYILNSTGNKSFLNANMNGQPR
jgi:hypothetical protein